MGLQHRCCALVASMMARCMSPVLVLFFVLLCAGPGTFLPVDATEPTVKPSTEAPFSVLPGKGEETGNSMAGGGMAVTMDSAESSLKEWDSSAVNGVGKRFTTLATTQALDEYKTCLEYCKTGIRGKVPMPLFDAKNCVSDCAKAKSTPMPTKPMMAVNGEG